MASDPASPRVKVCGITNLTDAELAVEFGAWALGLIFYPRSPRRCRLTDAEEMVASLRRRVVLCGVFVNATLVEVTRVHERLGLGMIQLHGDEGPAFCGEVARRTGARVIKAAPVTARADLQDLERFHTDFHLLDSRVDGLRGGTGTTFDWELLAHRRSDVPLILSGGLHAGNVTEAMRMAGPFAVDTASGTEVEPGRKDPGRLAEFFAAVSGGAEGEDDIAPAAPAPVSARAGA